MIVKMQVRRGGVLLHTEHVVLGEDGVYIREFSPFGADLNGCELAITAQGSEPVPPAPPPPALETMSVGDILDYLKERIEDDIRQAGYDAMGDDG